MARDPTRIRHFERIVEQLPERLAELQAAGRCPRKSHPPIPKAPGVYLFSENGMPVYVGQTRNLRTRIANHDRPSAGHNTASFAFNIAKHDAGSVPDDLNRDEIELLIEPFFTRAKERVAHMDIQFILMDDPIERTVFEVYAALHLGTEEYNSFETY